MKILSLIFPIVLSAVTSNAIIIYSPTTASVWYIDAPRNGSYINRDYNVVSYYGTWPDGHVISLQCDFAGDSILKRHAHIIFGEPPDPIQTNYDLQGYVSQPCQCRVRISEFLGSMPDERDGMNPVYSPYFTVTYLHPPAGVADGSPAYPSTAATMDRKGSEELFTISGRKMEIAGNASRPNGVFFSRNNPQGRMQTVVTAR